MPGVLVASRADANAFEVGIEAGQSQIQVGTVTIHINQRDLWWRPGFGGPQCVSRFADQRQPEQGIERMPLDITESNDFDPNV